MLTNDALLGGYDITGVTSIKVAPIMGASRESEDYYQIRKGSVNNRQYAPLSLPKPSRKVVMKSKTNMYLRKDQADSQSYISAHML